MEYPKNFEYLNFESGINTIQPKNFPESFPLHCHKYIEIIAVPENAKSKQSTIIRVNQALYQLNAGDILFIWPGELHETISAGGIPTMGVQFSLHFIQELPDFTPYINLFRTYKHITYENDTSLAHALQPHLNAMLKIKEEQEDFSETKCTICLLDMFMNFARYLQSVGNTDIKHHRIIKASSKINDACSYIIAHCQQELSLQTVSDYIGFNACYFSRMFKQTTGYHFVEYVMLQRVNAAQLLLIDSNMNITEVAYAAGFKSISTFNRVFKQYRGCSPRDYRKYYY